jgi:hypothetical protein
MKERRGFESDEENHEHDRRDAEENDCERKKSDREKHLAKMKARGRADVEVEVGMMDIVKSLEERDHMIDPMPPPVGVVHEQIRGDDGNPSRRL